MRYFAAPTNFGLCIRAAESRANLNEEDWKEVLDIRQHVSELGLDALHAGKRVDFDSWDQSYPVLNSLFYQE